MEYKNIDSIKTGLFIKNLREQHNWTQEQLGDKIFISRKSISKWETGRCCPSIDMLKRLSEVLGVTLEDLIAGEFVIISKEQETKRKRRLNNYLLYVLLFFLSLLLTSVISSRNYFINDVYRINYEDENFSILNGILMLGKYSYIDLGNLKMDLFKEIDSQLNFSIYLLIDNEELEIVEFNDTYSTLNLVEEQKNMIENQIVDNKLENLYLKIFYYNDNEEEISYRLNLDVKLKTASKWNNAIELNSKILKSNQKLNKKANFINIDKHSSYFDIDFIFNLSNDIMKKCFRKKEITVRNEQYFVDYILDLYNNDRYLKIYNDKQFIQLEFESSRVFIMKPVPIHYIINSNKILNFNYNDHYNFFLEILENVKLLSTCS